MKKIRFSICLLAIMLLCGCTSVPTAQTSKTQVVAATTYPVYCLVSSVAESIDGVTVVPIIQSNVSCLHDYTLTVADMRVLEGADIIVENGLGLEDFMSDALAQTSASRVDCSVGVPLLQGPEGDDPHIWMDPARAKIMVTNIAASLAVFDPDNADAYAKNAAAVQTKLDAWIGQPRPVQSLSSIITFHDGFSYFADALGLTIRKSIEEEAGSEASAQQIEELITLIAAENVPAIFTETNGSDRTAQMLARETGVNVFQLSMLMSGETASVDAYLAVLTQNEGTLRAALGHVPAPPAGETEVLP